MARARNLKPGFFKNEDLAECSPWARLCFAGLWTLADREGRLEDRPKRIKAELFAFDTVDVEPLLRELARQGFIVRYEIDGERFIHISKFLVHQTPHYAEKDSVIKPPKTQGFGPDEPPSKPKIGRAIKPPPIQGSGPDERRTKPGFSGSLRGGQNPLNPSSLNPSSLNPESPGNTARRRATPSPDRPDEVDAQVWADWQALRRAKKAPVTATVLANARAESAKVGMSLEAFLRLWCARGSQGLQAAWLAPPGRASPMAETAFQRSRRENVAAFTGGLVARQQGSEERGNDDAAAGRGAVAALG